MTDFLVSVLRGLYPLYFIFFIMGAIHRIKTGKWNRFDFFLLLFFTLFELLAIFHILFFYGVLITSKRYLWIGLPLSLPFAAEGLIWLSKFSFLRKVSTFLCIVAIGTNIYNTYSPVIHAKHSVRKNEERAISNQAATWIFHDWKNFQSIPIAVFKCDLYQSGKRPLVQSELTRIGWLCGGQNYQYFFSSQNIMPDYIVSRFPLTSSDYIYVKEIPPVKIYKSKKIWP